jgi:P-type Cu2+ transporter
MTNNQLDRFCNFPLVVHLVPGRVRFWIKRLTYDQKYREQLQKFLAKDNFVIGVRINKNASSVVINYRTQGKSDEEVLHYLAELFKQAGIAQLQNDSDETEENQNNLQESDEGKWSSLRLPLFTTLLAFIGAFWQLSILRPLMWGTLTVTVLPVAKRAFKSLFFDKRLNIDCLDFLALSLSCSQGRLLTPALVITLHELGDVIREQTARSTNIQTASLLDAIGHLAWVERDGQKLQVKSDQVRLGETVIVYPGEQIPVDGKVLQGKAVIDMKGLTGESIPVVAETGSMVFASTFARSGQIYIRAERVGNQTRAAASLELLQKAPVHDTRMANYASQLADKLIAPSLLLAGVIFVATRDAARAASILTLDFVTGIRVSMPTAFMGALNHTTRHGVLVRSGRTLELLADINTVVFDKTGTLTQGEIKVVGIDTLPGKLSSQRVLQLAAACEQRLTHPVAEAIFNHAEEQGIEIPERGEWNYEVGLGIRAEIQGSQVLVGSERFIRQEGIDIDAWEQQRLQVDRDASEWLSMIFVASNGEFQGAIKYADPLRPESRALIAQLQKKYGMEIHLLTGDNRQRALAVAQDLLIPESQVHAEAFPEQKAAIVRELNSQGKVVAFVGDGLNDSVALAYADVSVSFENGSDVARETADVVLMSNDLTSFLEAIAIAKETQNLIKQNTALVVTPNLVALGLASTLGLHPLVATAIHNGSAIAAGLNSLRPLAQHQLEAKK